MDIQEFKCLNLRSLASAYYHTSIYMPLMTNNPDDGIEHRYPSLGAFSELYRTAEPIAVTLGCGIYEYKKLKNVEDLQMLAARGIALLT